MRSKDDDLLEGKDEFSGLKKTTQEKGDDMVATSSFVCVYSGCF